MQAWDRNNSYCQISQRGEHQLVAFGATNGVDGSRLPLCSPVQPDACGGSEWVVKSFPQHFSIILTPVATKFTMMKWSGDNLWRGRWSCGSQVGKDFIYPCSPWGLWVPVPGASIPLPCRRHLHLTHVRFVVPLEELKVLERDKGEPEGCFLLSSCPSVLDKNWSVSFFDPNWKNMYIVSMYK
jgi:hypothetical protein